MACPRAYFSHHCRNSARRNFCEGRARRSACGRSNKILAPRPFPRIPSRRGGQRGIIGRFLPWRRISSKVPSLSRRPRFHRRRLCRLTIYFNTQESDSYFKANNKKIGSNDNDSNYTLPSLSNALAAGAGPLRTDTSQPVSQQELSALASTHTDTLLLRGHVVEEIVRSRIVLHFAVVRHGGVLRMRDNTDTPSLLECCQLVFVVVVGGRCEVAASFNPAAVFSPCSF